MTEDGAGLYYADRVYALVEPSTVLKRILKEPLLHFLVMGALLFGVFSYVSKEEPVDVSKRIVVDRERLLGHIRYRSKVLDAERVEELLDNLSDDEFQALIDEFVGEEVFYREAKALNLDKNDYAARQRLVRQLEFINQDFLASTLSLSEADLERFLNAHEDRYFVSPKITFTHVFFNAEGRGVREAESLAREKLNELNTSQVSFHEALPHGDRYLYHRNYVNKDAEEIASHFDAAMQQAVFALDVDESAWRGPFRSPYGYHLVMVVKRSAGYLPSLDEVRRRVAEDAAQDSLNAKMDEFRKSIVEGYELQIAEGLRRDRPSLEDLP